MSKFQLEVLSVVQPTIPSVPADTPVSEIRSPHIPSAWAPTTPLKVTLSLPSATEKNPIFPAAHLQVMFEYAGTGTLYAPDVVTGGDLARVGEGEYELVVPAKQVPRGKVNLGATTTAQMHLHAWKGEKLLGKFKVCDVEGLGIAGYKTRPSTV